MYRRQSPANSPVIRIMIVGVALGILYTIYSALTSTPSTAPDQPPSAVAQATDAGPTLTPTPQPTAIPTTLFIPAAGIYAPVITVYIDSAIQTWDVSNLGQNVGHLIGTGWFDQGTNIVLSGHVEMADGRAGIFAPIRSMEPGQEITLTHGDESRQYRVREVRRVAPNDMTVLYPTDVETLTLITCDGYDFLSNTYQERVVVIATRVETQ